MATLVDRQHGAVPAGPSPPRRWAAAGAWLAALTGSWAVPLLAHWLGVAFVLPVLVWVAVASLLRLGHTLVDRLVLAAVVLVGGTTIAGLLWSVWPWRLAPVPMAGAAFTGLVALAAVTGRRPQLRLPVTGRDAAVVAVGVATAAVVGIPLLRTDAAGRLALVLSGEDYSRHFAMYDATTHFGGYLFLHREARDVIEPLFTVYPTGSHLVAATLDSFLRNGAARPDAATAFDHYLGWYVATYAFFALCLAWAVRWVGGALLRGWWVLPCYAVVVSVVAFGEFVTLFVRGYPSEYAGLALFAVTFALLARPPVEGTSHEHMVVVAILWSGVSFAYYFLLPPLAVLAVWWAVRAWRALARRWIVLGATVAVVGPLSVVPPLLMATSFQPPTTHLLFDGPVVPVNRHLLVVLSLSAVAPMVARAARRSGTGRAVACGVLALAGYAAAIAGYQYSALGTTSYYFEKALHALLVGVLIALSGWGVLVVRDLRPGGGVGGAAAALATTAAVLTAFGVVNFRPTTVVRVPYGLPRPAEGVTWGRAYAAGKLAMIPEAEAVSRSLRGVPEGTNAPVIVFWNCDGRGMDFYATQFANALTRRLDRGAWTVTLRVPRADRGPVTGMLGSVTDRPVRVVTRDPATVSAVRTFASENPYHEVDVLLLPPRQR